MPWKELCAMDQKIQMIGDWMSDQYSIMELSQIYCVSRKTIYKWIERYQEVGASGLDELSRAPDRHPNASPSDVVEVLIATKLSHQKWGPKKIVAWLSQQDNQHQLPAVSTVGEIFLRAGLVRHRKRRHRTPPYTEPFLECRNPNEVWSCDYKGHFKTGDNKSCFPLTITDNNSRYLLQCRALYRPTYGETLPWLEWTFREHGLPLAMRTDNGVPFASVGLGGLTKLSVWFIKLGIRPERIDPGHPEQNGRHERMHRSLKEATAKPPKDTLQAQQSAFDEFVHEYNFQRPHEALGQRTPASIYRPSTRAFPAKLRKVEYDGNVKVRHVHTNGEIKWKGAHIFISETLVGESIALQQIDERRWELKYSFHKLGILDETTGKVQPGTNKKVLPMCPV
jgi:transposase InsO family protein